MHPKLYFRPHHFLCALGFIGKGYTPAFIENFSQITDQLRGPAGDETLIEILAHTDSICAPCPKKRDALCQDQTKIASLDARHQAILELNLGEQLSWRDAKNKLAEKMDIDQFHLACAGCEWQALGVCEKALLQLREEKNI